MQQAPRARWLRVKVFPRTWTCSAISGTQMGDVDSLRTAVPSVSPVANEWSFCVNFRYGAAKSGGFM